MITKIKMLQPAMPAEGVGKLISPLKFLYVVSIVLLAPLAVSANSTSWQTGITEGFFNIPGNWTNGVPDSTFTATFGITQDTEISFTQNHSVGTLNWWSGTGSALSEDQTLTLTLDLADNTFTAINIPSLSWRAPVAEGTTRRVLMKGEKDIEGVNLGIFENTGNSFIYVGHGSSASGNFEVVVDSGATFRTTAHLALQWDSSDTTPAAALFEVRQGGVLEVLNNRRIQIANSSGNDAELLVSGGRASNQNDEVRVAIGSNSTGVIRVTHGGTFQSGNDILLGYGSNSTGTLSVSGSGSTATASSLMVGGRSSSGVGMGVAEFLDGGHGDFNSLYVYHTVHGPESITFGTVTFDGGTMSVLNNAVFEALSVLNITVTNVAQGAVLSADNLTIDDVILNLSAGNTFSANLDDTIILLEYTGTLLGTFDSLPEGSIVSFGEYLAEISYLMEGGTAIGLTVVPEPATAAALLGMLTLAVVALRKRLRR